MDKDTVQNPVRDITEYEKHKVKRKTPESLHCELCGKRFPNLLAKNVHTSVKRFNKGSALLPAAHYNTDRHILLCTSSECCYSCHTVSDMNVHRRNFKHDQNLPPNTLNVHVINVDSPDDSCCSKCLRTFSRVRDMEKHRGTCLVSLYYYSHQLEPYNIIEILFPPSPL